MKRLFNLRVFANLKPKLLRGFPFSKMCLIIFTLIILCTVNSCKDIPVHPKFNETRNPIILSVSVFPEYVKPSDSVIVICNAMDPDADTLVYDWYLSSSRIKIKGGQPQVPALFNTHVNYCILYVPDSINITMQQDTFRIECAARDGKGGQVSEHVSFVVIENNRGETMQTIK